MIPLLPGDRRDRVVGTAPMPARWTMMPTMPTRDAMAASADGRQRRHPVKKRPRRRRGRREAHAEASYVCDSCGEEIVVPVDVSAGCSQDYVEDCPVCCHPMRLRVTLEEDGSAHIEGEHE